MIIARVEDDKGNPILLLLGLSKQDIKRLTAGQLIKVSGTNPGVPAGLEIAIMYGDTETNIEMRLRAAALGPQTEVKRDSRLES